jgi:hypothetical protein
MIGPPDPVSNLRPVAYHIPRNEHKIEKEFRICREEVQKWNEAFWTKHNKSFIKVQLRFCYIYKDKGTRGSVVG